MKTILHAISGSLVLFAAGCGSETSAPWKPLPKSSKTESKTADAETDDKAMPPGSIAPRPVAEKPAASKPIVLEPTAAKGLADFELTERSGRKVTKRDLLGKPSVVCFVFTQCAGPCSGVSSQMRKLQEWSKAEKVDVRLVSVSVDPERDTPAVMREYAKNFGADKDRWWFLTGDKKQVYRFVQSSLGQRIAELKGAQKGFEIDHSLSAVLLDAKGKIVEEYVIRDPVALAKLQQRLRRWKRDGKFDKT